MSDYNANNITFPLPFFGEQRYSKGDGQKKEFGSVVTQTTTYWYSINGGIPTSTTSLSSIPTNATLICTVTT